jgi:hypothetical protein
MFRRLSGGGAAAATNLCVAVRVSCAGGKPVNTRGRAENDCAFCGRLAELRTPAGRRAASRHFPPTATHGPPKAFVSNHKKHRPDRRRNGYACCAGRGDCRRDQCEWCAAGRLTGLPRVSFGVGHTIIALATAFPSPDATCIFMPIGNCNPGGLIEKNNQLRRHLHQQLRQAGQRAVRLYRDNHHQIAPSGSAAAPQLPQLDQRFGQ